MWYMQITHNYIGIYSTHRVMSNDDSEFVYIENLDIFIGNLKLDICNQVHFVVTVVLQ